MREKDKLIVLTGGPGGGKTLGGKYVVEKLRTLGWRPFFIPEVATIVIGGGVHDMGHIAQEDLPLFYGVQGSIADMQLKLEDEFRNLADLFPEDKKVFFLDRALIDQVGYVGKTQFEEILRARGLSFEGALRRYDTVIHMVSASIGAEKHYGKESNEERYEGLEWARALDRRLLAAWNPHPRVIVIDNSTDFDGKKDRLFREVCGILGIGSGAK